MVLIVFFSSRISPFTSTVILRDKSPRATAVVTSAMFRTCAGQVSSHGVHRIGEIFPGAGHAGHVGLSAKAPFATHFAGHTSDFGSERTQLLDHRVQRFFQLQNFAADVHRDLLGKVAGGDGCGHFRDVAHLARSGCWP